MNLLKRSTADYVMFSDQDDVWKPDKINQEMLAILKEESVEPGVPVLVASDLVVVSASLGVINKSFWDYQKLSPKRCQFRELCAQSIAPGCTMLINRELVQLARDSYGANMVMHDWWISLIASAFGRVRLIPQQTMLYRQHGDNSVGATQYSLTKKIFKFEKAKQGVMATLTQAEAFLEHFGSCLPKRYLRQLQSYAGILHESSGALRLARLIKSRCWKAGIARKVGQIVAVMSLSADSSNTN